RAASAVVADWQCSWGDIPGRCVSPGVMIAQGWSRSLAFRSRQALIDSQEARHCAVVLIGQRNDPSNIPQGVLRRLPVQSNLPRDAPLCRGTVTVLPRMISTESLAASPPISHRQQPMSRFLIGIDLGTTNSALAYLDLSHTRPGGRVDI